MIKGLIELNARLLQYIVLENKNLVIIFVKFKKKTPNYVSENIDVSTFDWHRLFDFFQTLSFFLSFSY